MAIRVKIWRSRSRLKVESLEARDVPATFSIANGNVAGLIAAINMANTDGQADVINLAPGGTYTFTAVGDTTFGPTALPGILADGNFTMQGHGATLQRSVTAPPFRLLLVNGGNLTLDQVSVVNGASDPTSSTNDGGGLRLQAGSLSVNGSSFVNNQASRFLGGMGGAIALETGTTATISGSTFTGNTAQSGGAINGRGATVLTVRDSTFGNNQALGSLPINPFFGEGFEGSGGAIHLGGFGTATPVTTILDSTFTGNLATTGGGLTQRRGQLSVVHSSFTGNQATLVNLGLGFGSNGGGGINTYFTQGTIADSSITGNTARSGGGIEAYGTAYYGAPPSSLTVTGSTVSGNVAESGSGGGVLAYGTTLAVTDSTISGNSAGGDGGGVSAYSSYFSSSTVKLGNTTISGNTAGRTGGGVGATYNAGNPPPAYYGLTADAVLNNCTVTANTAADGGGIAHDSVGTITLGSTIVADNHAAAATSDISGDVTADHSLIGDTTGGLVSGASNLVGTAAMPIEARLGPLANNGGPTRTTALLRGSPAINAGANPDGLASDQRGQGYFRVAGGTTDIGAFEAQNLGLTVAATTIDDGSAQRSMVRQLTVTFHGLGSTTAADFMLTRIGGGFPGDVTFADGIVGGNLVATLTFSGPGIFGGSLADGRYDLTFHGTDVSQFHRLFGDVNGDARIDNTDLAAFGAAFGSHAGTSRFRSYFDFNGDQYIGGLDLIEILVRYGRSLPPPGP